MKYLVVAFAMLVIVLLTPLIDRRHDASLSFLPTMALAQTAQPLPPAALASQQSIARVNGDRELVETAIRHYEESVVLNDQSRQGEIAALTEQVQWWKDCTSEKIAGCREWVMSMSPKKP